MKHDDDRTMTDTVGRLMEADVRGRAVCVTVAADRGGTGRARTLSGRTIAFRLGTARNEVVLRTEEPEPRVIRLADIEHVDVL